VLLEARWHFFLEVAEGAIPLDDSWTAGFAPPFHPNCYCAIVSVPKLKSDKPEV